MNRQLFGIFFLCIASFFAAAQSSRIQVQKEPAWITSLNPDYNNHQQDAQAEDGYIDLTYQKQVSLASNAIYYKKAVKILSEAGVQNSSEISVDFDPLYEQLSFHSIKIIRDGEAVNKLAGAKFKTIHKETDINRFMYNGTLTALLFLEDVRKGDVIEYSYTITGFNPIFRGKYSDLFELGFSVPIAQLYYKLVVPQGRDLSIKNSLTNINAQTEAFGTATAYSWKLENIAPIHVQGMLPSWYDAYPMVMVSEYKSWGEVAAWAHSLFPENVPLAAGLKNKIDAIMAAEKTPEGRTVAALRFVQDDVRYLGIEMGSRSHQPANPNKIFAQRFGDCKDKSYLLCTMLQAMGIEAHPVLINTAYKATIKNWLPSARTFDHATVNVRLNGRNYWFDATIPYQRGSIDSVYYPDYQCGLVLADGSNELTNISANKNAGVSIKERFDIPDMSGRAKLVVTTHYRGNDADRVRNDFNNTSQYELLKNYKEFYTHYFEKITADSLQSQEEKDGSYTTYEYYTIADLWQSKAGILKASFSPFVIYSVFKKPTETERTMPFYLEYPTRYKEEVEVNLPEEWNAEPTSSVSQCANFIFKESCTPSYKQIRLEYEYENLSDHVSPEEAKDYFDSYKKADENVNYNLTWKSGSTALNDNSDSGDAALSTDTPFGSLYMALGLCVVITVVVRRQKKARGY